MALIEGIFYAKILIATDIANHKELLGKDLVFDNSVEAFVKKIKEVYENYDKYEQLFIKIKEKRENFSIEKMVEQYVQAYKSLLK